MMSKLSALILLIRKGAVFVPDLIAKTPLGGTAPRVDRHGPVTLTEVVDTALASVAARLGREDDTATLMQSLIDAPAPTPAAVGGTTLEAFWTGPDQWMVEASFASNEDLAARITSKASGCASVTEQTDAWCRFDLHGAQLPDLFERLCVVNTRAFKGKEATRCSIEHLGCFLICRAPDHYTVYGPRSSAGSLHHALLVGMRSAF
jgi:sarcosine oxidase subunit gamma